MKKSGKVTLGFVAGTAMVLLGCQRTATQRCVNTSSQVVEDFYCDPARPATYHGFYHWYYGGSGGFRQGTYVNGGSSIATPGVGHSSSTGVSRGGFGGHGSAHSAGS